MVINSISVVINSISEMQGIFVNNIAHLNRDSKYTEKNLREEIEINQREFNKNWGPLAICKINVQSENISTVTAFVRSCYPRVRQEVIEFFKGYYFYDEILKTKVYSNWKINKKSTPLHILDKTMISSNTQTEINVTEVSVQTDEAMDSRIKSKEVSVQTDRDIDSLVRELTDHYRKHKAEIWKKDSQLEMLKRFIN